MKVDQCNKKLLFCCVSSFFRHFLSLLLILALLPMSLAVPAMADEVEPGNYVQILDYGFPVGRTNNRITLTPDGTEQISNFTYPNPYGYTWEYFDIVFRTDDTSPRISTSQGFLTIVSIGDGFYRAYGRANSISPAFGFRSDDGTYFEVLSFRASLRSTMYYETVTNATVTVSALPPLNFSYSFPDNAFLNWTFDDNQYTNAQGRFEARYYFSDWEKYDRIDLQLKLVGTSLTSVAAFFGDSNLPVEVSEVILASNHNNSTFVTISIDVSGLSRLSSNQPTIVVNGTSRPDETNQLNIFDCAGHVLLDDPSPLTVWFTRLQTWLSSGFTSVNTGLSGLGTNISTLITSLGTNINSWITSQTSSLETIIGALHQSVINGFKNVIYQLGTIMSTHANNIIDNISDGVDAIVDAITGGDNADDLQQGADQIGEAGSSLGSNIGSIHDFEDQYFGQLDSNMGTIVSAGNISGIVAPLAFVQRYTNMIVAGIPSNFMVIFTLPILLGIFMFMVNHRIKVPHPDRSGDNVTHEVGGRSNDSVG